MLYRGAELQFLLPEKTKLKVFSPCVVELEVVVEVVVGAAVKEDVVGETVGDVFVLVEHFFFDFVVVTGGAVVGAGAGVVLEVDSIGLQKGAKSRVIQSPTRL